MAATTAERFFLTERPAVRPIPVRKTLTEDAVDRGFSALTDQSKSCIQIHYFRSGAVHELRVPFSTEQLRVEVYLSAILNKLAGYLSLPAGWDRQNASQISENSVQVAIGLISLFRELNLPMPSLVPLSSGGLQFEWHKGEKDLEVEIRRSGNIVVLYGDGDEEDEFDLDAEQGLERLDDSARKFLRA